MRKMMMAAAFALAATTTAPAAAQQNSGLIAVQIGDVEILRNSVNNNQVELLNNFLNNNNLLNNNQLAAPITVQVPIGIAANVCNTTVAVLSAAGSGGTCEAKQASRALNQAIIRQMMQKKGSGN
ncbi:MAG TPA: hypothetical protein VM265_03220 [Sphingomicrobium sp.]|nr:hypothetical protein [Sphingomicrobium sp.]